MHHDAPGLHQAIATAPTIMMEYIHYTLPVAIWVERTD
jgi:hypothetical protein